MVVSNWIEARSKRITATDAAAIYGVGFDTPYALWCGKTGRRSHKDLSANEAVYWGTVLEPIVIRECQLRSGRRLAPKHRWQSLTKAKVETYEHEGETKIVLVHPDMPLLSCTPDDVFEAWKPLPDVAEQQQFEGPGALEAKTAGQFMTSSWDEGVPLYYQIQVQMQLLITGWSWACVPVLIGGRDFRMYDIARDDVFCQRMVEQIHAWWDRHVVGDMAPPVEANDKDLLDSLYPKDDGKTIMLPAEWSKVDRRFQRWKAIHKRAEGEIKAISTKFRAAFGDASYAAIEGTAIQYSCKLYPRAGYTVEPTEYRKLVRTDLGKSTASTRRSKRKGSTP